MRLLPPEHEMGWTAYAWLIYLGFFLIDPIIHDFSLLQWSWVILAIAVFLLLYFRAFWERGIRLLILIAAITMIGVITAPLSSGASAFFIYGAAFACDVGPPRRAIAVIGAIITLCFAEAWLLDLPPWFWIPGVVISVVVGGVNIYWAERRRSSARLRQVQRQMATIAERDRIARDLHDLLGHNLSMVILKTELASKLFDREPERARAEIREVESISRETLGRVREAVTGFRSRGIEREAELVKEHLSSAGIETRLDIDAPELGPTRENVLALFLREAGTNIIRHAGAKRAWIGISQSNGRCDVEVRDDGRGGIVEEGFGIRGMRSRIEAVGGTFEITSDAGTELRVSIPLPDRTGMNR